MEAKSIKAFGWLQHGKVRKEMFFGVQQTPYKSPLQMVIHSFGTRDNSNKSLGRLYSDFCASFGVDFVK